MPASLLFLGFDSMNAALTEKWARSGYLPNFADLQKRARAFRLENYLDALPGSIWLDIATGRGPDVHGRYYSSNQYCARNARSHPMKKEDLDPELYVWSEADKAGLRCAVIDQPFQVLCKPFRGVQICEFALHDLTFGFRTWPRELAGDLERRFGPVPLQTEVCDAFMERHSQQELHELLLRRAEIKTDLLAKLLEESWDFFFAVFAETHCGAHYHWPREDREGTEEPFGHLLEVYRKMDLALGRLSEAAGPDAAVVVSLSHSIGPYIGGPQLLSEVLNALGVVSGPDPPLRRSLRNLFLRGAQKLPLRFRKVLRSLAGGGTGNIERALGRNTQPFLDPACQAATISNNRCGAIRLNVSGRDPHGRVSAEDAEILSDRLQKELLALVDPSSGNPIVAGVDRIDELFEGPRHPDLPDLIVRFRTDVGPIEACQSESVGRIRVSLNRPGYERSGDHTPDNRTYVRAPGYAPGRSEGGHVLDIAPTLLSLSGVDPPPGMRGRPLPKRGT